MLLQSKAATGSDSLCAPCVMYVTGNSGAEGAKACTVVLRVIHNRALGSRWGYDVALRFVNLLFRWSRGWFSYIGRRSRACAYACAYGPTKDSNSSRNRASLIQQECIRRELITSNHVHNFVQYYDYEHTDSDRSL